MFIGLGTVGRLPEGVCMGIRLMVDGWWHEEAEGEGETPKNLNLNLNRNLALTPPDCAIRAFRGFPRTKII